MKANRLLLVALLLCALIALAACGSQKASPSSDEQSARSAQSAPEPQAQVESQEDEDGQETEVSASEPVSDDEAEPEEQDEQALPESEQDQEEEEAMVYSLEEAGITSYRQRITYETDLDDEMSINEMLIEYTADGPATRMVITADTPEESFEMVEIADVTYLRSGTEDWISMQVEGESATFTAGAAMAWFNVNDIWNDKDCDYKGKETVEGEQTRHYQCKSSLLLGQIYDSEDEELDFSASYADLYVSEEYSVPIKSKVHWEGTSDGQAFYYDMGTLVTDINSKIEIEAPEGAKAPGMDDDIPIPDNATGMTSLSGMVSFTVPNSVTEMAAWYEAGMAAAGWEPQADASMDMQGMSMRGWAKDTRTVNLMINEADDGTSVTLIIEAE